MISLVIFISVYTIIFTIFMLINLKSIKNMILSKYNTNITPESKTNDLFLVFSAIDRAILKSLYIFSRKDFSFSEKSTKKTLNKYKYRDLILCLVRPDVFFDDPLDKNATYSLFEAFVNKVYLIYISETSLEIKNLFYKYYSGYTIEEYHMKNKPTPSILSFLTEYVRNYIWARYVDNQDIEQKLLEEVRMNTGENRDLDYLKLADIYDQACSKKICLDMYHINDLGLNSINNDNKNVKPSIVRQKTSEFGYDFAHKKKEIKPVEENIK